MESSSMFIAHVPCPECGSSDANSLYDDGHTYCFKCGTNVQEAGASAVSQPKKTSGLIAGQYQDLVKRKIREDTCRKFGYQVGAYQGYTVHIAPYFDKENVMVAQKIRMPDKSFKILGDISKAQLFGAKLFNGGKKIVVTEGEIDCLTVSQAQGNKWAVVSVPNGAAGAKKAIQRNLEFFTGFEEVIFMFDMDEAGQAATKDCVELFEAGKAKVAVLSRKDPNELLQAGLEAEIITAIWNAKAYRPDGILSGNDLWEMVSTITEVNSVPYPWAALNDKTLGARRGELVTITAGSGIGKSAVVREIAHHLLTRGETVGMLMLEENPKRTALGLMGIEMNKPLHLLDRSTVDESLFKDSYNNIIANDRLYLYDHFGSSDVDNLVSRIRYLSRGCGCSWVILDHLSIVVSGLGDGDERKLIDRTMTMLRTLVEETGIGLFVVSHLKRPEGKGHEEGAKTSLSQLRGSHAIAQLSDMVISMERDQQSVNPNLTTLRVLKNRFSGDTGEAGYLLYDKETGRLVETTMDFDTEQLNEDFA
jgi:twinkle protein